MLKQAVILFAILAMGQPSFAAPARTPREEAVVLWRDAIAKYDVGDFRGSIVLLHRAYKLDQDPAILFNLAQSHRHLKEYKEAVFFYRSFLRNDPKTNRRAVVETQIDEMEKLMEEQARNAQRPPDGVVQPTGPVPVRPVDAPEGPTRWYERKGGWVLAGTGVVLAGVGIAFYVSAGQTEDQIPSASETERQSLRDSAGTSRTIGTLSLVGAGLAVAGAVLVFSLPSGSSGSGPKVKAVGLSPRGIVIGGEF